MKYMVQITFDIQHQQISPQFSLSSLLFLPHCLNGTKPYSFADDSNLRISGEFYTRLSGASKLLFRKSWKLNG